MRTALLMFLVLMPLADVKAAEPPTLKLSVSVEVTSYAKVCAKAIAVLVARHKITADEAREQLLVPGDLTLRTGTCLEVIFTGFSSPSNGYKVGVVSAYPGIFVDQDGNQVAP